MNTSSVSVVLALAFAAFMASLSAVAWRQGRARSVMQVREQLRIELAQEKDALGGLDQQVRSLTSRRLVIERVESDLGMRMPGDAEVIHLTGGQ